MQKWDVFKYDNIERKSHRRLSSLSSLCLVSLSLSLSLSVSSQLCNMIYWTKQSMYKEKRVGWFIPSVFQLCNMIVERDNGKGNVLKTFIFTVLVAYAKVKESKKMN
jgi:hypothetical protein